jgi:Protein of unknown function (DUF4012)
MSVEKDRPDGAPGPRHARVSGPAPERVALVALLAALIGMLLWLAMLVNPWRLASGLLESRTQLQKAAAALAEGANKKARLATLSASAAAQRAAGGLGSGSPLLDLTMASSAVRNALGETEHLVRAASHSATAARGTLKVSQNALKGPYKIIAEDPEDPASKTIRIDRIEAIGELISTIRESVNLAKRELVSVDERKIPGRFRGGLRRGIAEADKSDDVLADAEAGFAILPGVLGEDGTRTYLLGIQNSAELRGTGGSLLQFKILEITDGKPSLKKSGSIYKVDRNRRQLAIPLPEDAWYVAGIDDAKRAGNANWSPDWPLSAKLTVDYAQASGARFPDQIDGVIGVDPTVLQELLPGTGKPNARIGTSIRSENVVHYVLYQAYASFPIPGVRRAALQQIVDGFYQRLFNPASPTALIPGLGRALAQKHMQIWLDRPEEQRFIERMNWDGAIDKAKGSDFLYVVEQNVGGNKLDYFDEQTNSMNVVIDGRDARVSTEVRIRNGAYLPLPRYVLGDAGPLHRPMINVYVPPDAQLERANVSAGTLLEASPTPELAAWVGERPPRHLERGKQVWSTTLEIPPQEEGAVRFEYRVPDVVRTADGRKVYRLVVQRQPKVRSETLRVELTLPEGATGVDAPGWSRDAGALLWERPLNKDEVLEVSWRD